MKLRIDAGMCTGHGRCYALAPEVFEPDDDGHGVALNGGDVAPGREDAARRAGQQLPGGGDHRRGVTHAVPTVLSAVRHRIGPER